MHTAQRIYHSKFTRTTHLKIHFGKANTIRKCRLHIAHIIHHLSGSFGLTLFPRLLCRRGWEDRVNEFIVVLTSEPDGVTHVTNLAPLSSPLNELQLSNILVQQL